MEQEKLRKRKDTIKNIAIVFLTIMLVLTFFSNTIMNYSLPEVATQMVQPGKITSKVRGTGMVSVSEPYNISISESRTIARCLVKTGDKVQKGDTIFELEDSESTELKEAQDALDSLIVEYEKSILSGDTTVGEVNSIQNGTDTGVSAKQQEIQNAKAELEAWKERVNALTSQASNLQKQIDLTSNETVDTSSEREKLQKLQNELTKEKKKLAKLETKKTTAQTKFERYGLTAVEIENYDAEVNAAKSELDSIDINSEEVKNAENYEEIKAKYDELKQKYDALIAKKNNINEAKKALTAYDKAIAAYDEQNLVVTQKELDITNVEQKIANKENAGTSQDEVNELKNQLIETNSELADANLQLTVAQEDYDEVLKNVLAEVDLGAQNEKIKKQTEVVEKLKEKAIDAKVLAPVSGTVTQVNYAAGEKVNADETMAVMQIEGKAYSLTVPVTIEQAKLVRIGNKAELQDAWNYNDDVEVTLAEIRPDPEDKVKSKLLVFEVSGEVTEGSQMNISVGESSRNYDLIVPTSAIREDKDGKFVLVVESKSSPLGNRYIANKVDVEVVASDDTSSAITAPMFGNEFVITTSTKPIEPKQQVRLTN